MLDGDWSSDVCSSDLKALNDGVASLRAVAGVNGAILVDQYGLVVAAALDESLDEGLAGALITNIYRTTSGNSVKLTVGQFEEGLIEGESGNIHIVQIEEMILAVFAQSGVKMGMLEKSIRTLYQLSYRGSRRGVLRRGL
jgi:predicted regulator of Ras-like GTPase activity (Roadblock/LC7/MglB family)